MTKKEQGERDGKVGSKKKRQEGRKRHKKRQNTIFCDLFYGGQLYIVAKTNVSHETFVFFIVFIKYL